jgi:hypothetical protein
MLASEHSPSLMRLNRQVVALDSSPNWRVYRVVAVTEEGGDRNSPQNNSSDNFVLSTTAPCYCTPWTAFWLSSDGIEMPNAECIIIEFENREDMDCESAIVEFDYDGGRYVGTVSQHDCRPSWAENQQVDATVCNISSL